MAEQKGGRALLMHGRPSEHVRQSVHVTEPGAGRPRQGRPGSWCAHMQSTKIAAAVAACLTAGRRRANAGGTKLPASARSPKRPGVTVGGESSVIPSDALSDPDSRKGNASRYRRGLLVEVSAPHVV
jgi:hypothetical protein